jgi:hypothetical protein
VAIYLFYLLGRDGQIERGTSVQCRDDAEAIEQATALKHVHRVEIRQESRWVATVPPQPST